LKRNTLTKNLKEMIERTKHVFLPVSIMKIFVHGSYLRGDELPGDLDIIILVKVKEEFEQWHGAFKSLGECHDLIVECYEKSMSLEDAFRGPLVHEIGKRNIPLEWVATMSWSELFGQSVCSVGKESAIDSRSIARAKSVNVGARMWRYLDVKKVRLGRLA
jgi:predicted nucleotidyltransferase